MGWRYETLDEKGGLCSCTCINAELAKMKANFNEASKTEWNLAYCIIVICYNVVMFHLNVAILGKLFTPCHVPLNKQSNWYWPTCGNVLRLRITAGLAKSRLKAAYRRVSLCVTHGLHDIIAQRPL